MKPYVDIDDSDGIATYHYPMSLIRKDASKDTDAEQEGFLEELNNRRFFNLIKNNIKIH